MELPANLRMYCPAAQQLRYFTEAVRRTTTQLQTFLGDHHQIHLYPEATIKTNKMPNGLAISSETKHSVLIPQLLRDPGCGFLIFKLKHPSEVQRSELYRVMDRYLLDMEETILYPVTYKAVKQSLKQGIFDLAPEDSWDGLIHHDFKPDLSVLRFKDNHYYHLMSDMNTLTNSIELKTLDNEPGSIIGMIHTGSEVFPRLILNHWFESLHKYTIENLHENQSMIAEGFWGVHAVDILGYEYTQWIKAAMNFCLYKRYHMFKALRKHLQTTLGIDLELINDRCHAGLFEKKISGRHYQIQSRGVQPLEIERSKLFMIAGHRETISLLLNLEYEMPDSIAYIGHGTGYTKDPKVNYRDSIPDDLLRKCMDAYDSLHTNTPKNLDDLLPFTANLLNQYEGILSPSQYELAFPLYNYMGHPLKGLYT